MALIVRIKGISVTDVVKKYLNDGFLNADSQKLPPIRRPVINNGIVGRRHGTSSQDDSYKHTDKNNNQVTVQTSNHRNFQLFNESGGAVKKGGICDYCKYKFESFCVGYPLSMYEKTLVKDDQTFVFYVFNMKGEFCTFECVRAFLDMFSLNSGLNTSLQYLLFLYKLIYGGRPLACANDRYLLEDNGGTLSRNEWLSQASLYLPTNKVICAPVKSEYIVKNIDYCNSLKK